jgi:4-amino-4-deoxy-L-arabinose transferase-like glycosyltransferase
VLGSRAQAVALVAVLTCMPELMIDVCRAGNECLGVVIFSLLTLVMLWAVTRNNDKWFLAAGGVLGLGLLSKAYFLAAVPAFIVIALYSAYQRGKQRKSVLLNAAIGLSVAAAISFAWYWRNHSLTGSWSGEINDVNAAHGGMLHLLASVGHVNWMGGVASVLVSHVWFGGWSFLKLPKPIYFFFLLGMGAALAGMAKRIAAPESRHDSKLVVLCTIYAFFWLGLLYDMLITFVSVGSSSSTGWYMYAVVVPEMLLVALAFNAITPQGFRWMVLPLLGACFAAIDLYGVGFLLIPYYTGLSAHSPGSDLLKPMPLTRLFHTSPGLVLQRLAVNRPASLRPAGITILASAYLIATLSAVWIAFRSARQGSSAQGSGTPHE